MTDPTEIARVAAGLTRAQRDWILTGKGYSMVQLATDRKGLTTLFPIGNNKYDRILTRIGLAVRDHILREKSGG